MRFDVPGHHGQLASPALAAGAKGVSGGTSVGVATVTTTATETTPAVTGGSTTTTTTTSSPAPVTKKPATPHAPVTARSSSVLYKGPVYEKTAIGEVVPYVVPPPIGQTNGDTGGSIADLAADDQAQTCSFPGRPRATSTVSPPHQCRRRWRCRRSSGPATS